MRLLIFGVLLFARLTAIGQFKAEQTYYLSEHFEKNECRARTYPNWGELILLSDDKFLTYGFFRDVKDSGDSSHLVGQYIVKDKTLILSSIRNFYPDSLRSKPHLAKRVNQKYHDVIFKVDACDNGKILLRAKSRGVDWYGVRATKEKEENTIRYLKERGYWDVLLAPKH